MNTKKQALENIVNTLRSSCSGTGWTQHYSRPVLTPKNLNNLMWFRSAWDAVFDLAQESPQSFEQTFSWHDFEFEALGESVARHMPGSVWDDVYAGIEYLEKLCYYGVLKNKLRVYVDASAKETDIYYLSEKLFEDHTIYANHFGHLHQHANCYSGKRLQSATRNPSGSPRKPTITRKRANGLWWFLAIWEAMECEGLRTYGAYWIEQGEMNMWDEVDDGLEFVRSLALHHESLHPTAIRGGAA